MSIVVTALENWKVVSQERSMYWLESEITSLKGTNICSLRPGRYRVVSNIKLSGIINNKSKHEEKWVLYDDPDII